MHGHGRRTDAPNGGHRPGRGALALVSLPLAGALVLTGCSAQENGKEDGGGEGSGPSVPEGGFGN